MSTVALSMYDDLSFFACVQRLRRRPQVANKWAVESSERLALANDAGVVTDA